jgi:hypothetical protein
MHLLGSHLRRLAIGAAFLVLIEGPAFTTPPPPPPIEVVGRGETVCNRQFAFRLTDSESAERYGDDWWVIRSAKVSVGIRAFGPSDVSTLRRSLRAKDRLRAVAIQGREGVSRRKLFYFPDGAPAGWEYWIPQIRDQSGSFVLVSSQSFSGSRRDIPWVQRVLVGKDITTLCPSSSSDGMSAR